MKLPMVLVQLCSQRPFAVLHSLMSMEQRGIDLAGQSLCSYIGTGTSTTGQAVTIPFLNLLARPKHMQDV